MTKDKWVSVSSKFPEVNGGYFSKKLFLKVNGKQKTGYYDGYLLKWFYYDKHDLSNQCTPTHWKPITPKK